MSLTALCGHAPCRAREVRAAFLPIDRARTQITGSVALETGITELPGLFICFYWASCDLIISSILALTALKLNEAGACMGG